MFALGKVIHTLEDVEAVTDAHCPRSYGQFDVIVKVVFCLACVVCFFEMHVRVFFDDPVAHPHVRFHRTKRILLLHKVDSYMLAPSVGAGLVEQLEIFLFTEHFQSEEDKSSRKMRMFLHNLIINFIECAHILTIVMHFHNVAIFIVLGKLAKKGSELNSFVSVFNEFQQSVTHVFFEKMQAKYNREEIGYFLLEKNPEFMLFSSHNSKFFFGKHSQIRNQLNQPLLIGNFCPQLVPTHPSFSLRLLFSTNFEAFPVCRKIDVGIGHYYVEILNIIMLTKS